MPSTAFPIIPIGARLTADIGWTIRRGIVTAVADDRIYVTLDNGEPFMVYADQITWIAEVAAR